VSNQQAGPLPYPFVLRYLSTNGIDSAPYLFVQRSKLKVRAPVRQGKRKNKYTWIYGGKWGQALIPWGGRFKYMKMKTAGSKKLRKEVDRKG
jgi:hypothetical protein